MTLPCSFTTNSEGCHFNADKVYEQSTTDLEGRVAVIRVSSPRGKDIGKLIYAMPTRNSFVAMKTKTLLVYKYREQRPAVMCQHNKTQEPGHSVRRHHNRH